MSVPKENRLNAKLQYKNKMYGVFNAPLSDEIVKKLESYDGDKKWIDTSAPWRTPQLLWTLEENKLYLSTLYVNGLLEELMGSPKVLASWVDELKLLVEERTVCKTYEEKDSYLKKQIILHLFFNKGLFSKEEKETELYIKKESKNNMDRDTAYTTLRMNSNDLRIYLEDDKQSGQDQLLPIFSALIGQMLDEYDEISLDMNDLKDVLSRGDDALFLYVKGKDIDKIVDSLVSSLTNENLLSPKGCLLHLMIHEKYPKKSVIKIIETIDEGFNFNFEPLKPELKEPFYTGTRFNNDMDDDEVSIMILVTI